MKPSRLILLLLTCLVLTSCATFKSPFDNSDPLSEFITKPPRNGKGLVSLLVTPNSGKVDWQRAALSVRKLGASGNYSGQPIRLLPVPLSTSSETVAYIGKLYPGRYSITEMSQTRLIGDYQAVTDVLTLSKEGDADALVFNVESDKLSDAGRLLVNSAGSDWTAAWSSDRQAGDDIERGNAAVAEYLSGFATTIAAKRSANHRIVQSLATRSPAGAFNIQRQAKQGIVAGSRLGAVLRRSGSGQWQRTRVGQFQRVLSLSADAEGQLLFAGEDNLLGYQFTKTQGNKPAIKFRYIDTKGIPIGQFIKVYWSESRGLLVVHQNGDMVRLFTSKSVKKAKWKLLAEVTQSKDVPVGVPPARLEVVGDYVALAVYPTTIVTSASATSDWITNTAAGEISDFQVRSGGLLRVLTVSRYSGSVTARDSATDGAGWRKLAIAPRTRVLPIQVNRYELSLRNQQLDADRIAVRLLKKSRKGKRWQPQGRIPVGQFFVVDEKHFFVAGSGFDVLRTDDGARVADARDFVAFSADGGDTWVREREQ